MMANTNGRAASDRIPSDEEVIRGLAAGGADALRSLHSRYAPLIFNIAARSLGPNSAEEIVQDVFVAIWRKAGTFDPARGSFRSWVLRITHLRVINEFRRRSRRPRIEVDPEETCLGNLPEHRPGPDEQAWLAHRRAIVRAAVDALPQPHRQALSLAFLDELSHQQVAQTLGLPLGTAKTRIRAGLQRLRAHLAPLLAAGLLMAGLITGVMIRDEVQRARLRKDEAALRLVTSSDVVPRRLVAAPGTPPETHGNYRGRPGVPLSVFTISHLSPAPAGQLYRAWAQIDGRWYLLGNVEPNANGSDLVISEAAHLATPPAALKVTLEPRGASEAPSGATVILWPAP